MTERILFTSDTHYFHKKIQTFCPNTRRGSDYMEMTETLVYNWNSQVRPQDKVYHLGDVSFGSSDQTRDIVHRLNGEIHLILGNHDNRNLLYDTHRFRSIQHYAEIKIEGHHLCLFHYPIKEWNRIQYGSFHLFGHVHGRDPGVGGRSLDVGVDNRPNGDMMLWTWEEVRDLLLTKEILKHHERTAE